MGTYSVMLRILLLIMFRGMGRWTLYLALRPSCSQDDAFVRYSSRQFALMIGRIVSTSAVFKTKPLHTVQCYDAILLSHLLEPAGWLLAPWHQPLDIVFYIVRGRGKLP